MVEVGFSRAETVKAWAERMNRSGRHLCQCGTALVILPRHRSIGLPRYVHGHHPNPLCRGFDALRKKGYRLVGEVAKLLGVSENSVRRMEAEGVIPKARHVELARGKSVRAFTTREAERIARLTARERWRAAAATTSAGDDRRRQNSRKPARYQRRAVSDWTRTIARCHDGNHRAPISSFNRSTRWSFGRALRRRSTLTW